MVISRTLIFIITAVFVTVINVDFSAFFSVNINPYPYALSTRCSTLLSPSYLWQEAFFVFAERSLREIQNPMVNSGPIYAILSMYE